MISRQARGFAFSPEGAVLPSPGRKPWVPTSNNAPSPNGASPPPRTVTPRRGSGTFSPSETSRGLRPGLGSTAPSGLNAKLRQAWIRGWVVTWGFLGWAILSLFPETTSAQMSAPSVRSTKPLALVPGQSTKLEIHGEKLEGATALLFDSLVVNIESLEPSKDVLKTQIRLPNELAPGVRFFRVITPKGLSNPSRVVVTRPIPWVEQKAPNHGFRAAQLVASPCTVEGILKNGDGVDVYSVEMKAGQILVAESVAARMGSGLDALVTIFSPDGRELASDDDLFGRDAACWATIPTTGRYFVQIQDANGRNPDGNAESKTTREYLLTIGDLPLVISAFPAGARRGTKTPFDVLGVNFPEGLQLLSDFPAETPPGDNLLKIVMPKGMANALSVRVGDGPELNEPDPESADDPLRPLPALVPGAINGRFRNMDDGDIDYYQLVPIPGQEGDYAITVYAARMGSPADPIVSIVDPRGTSQAEDDDKLGRDARIERRIPAEGITIAVREAFGRGGPRFIYRVEVEPLAPRRITVTADLGGRSVPRNGSIAIPITLDRQGDDGVATILTGELPPGVTSAPVTIPAKAKGGILVLSATAEAPLGVFPFRLVVRDTKGLPQFAYRERAANNAGPSLAVDRPILTIAEAISLGVRIEPEEVVARPGETVAVRVLIERRGETAKGPIKLRLSAGVGGLDGFEKIDEATVPPEKMDHVFQLRSNPGASSRRIALTAQAWFVGGSDLQAIDARPTVLIVP
jgi:hypothetical protein